MAKTDRELERILFTDEHYVNVNDHGSRGHWTGRKGGPVPQDVIPRQTLMWSNVANMQMWAGIGLNYKTDVVFFPKKNSAGANWKMDASKYIELCLTDENLKVWKERGFTLMQDGAKAHTAKIVSAHLATKQMPLLANWPAESPDLNPIENLWSLLNCRIEEYYPRTLADLITATKKAWDSITFKEVNKFVRSFKHKCQKVQAAGNLEPDDDKVPRKPRNDTGVPRGAYKK